MKLTTTRPWAPLVCVLSMIAGAGCGESGEFGDDLLDRTADRSAPLVGTQQAVEEPPLDDAVIREISDVWSVAGRDCALDLSDHPSPEEVMQSVAPEDRAAAIKYVLQTPQRSTRRLGRLLQLLGAAAGDSDQATAKYITKLFDDAREVAAQILADQLATYDPRNPRDEGFEEYFENAVARVRVHALRSVALVPGPESLALLERELDSSDPRLRQAAAVGLAGRDDYDDPGRLGEVVEQLDPAMRPAIEAALDSGNVPDTK